MNPNYQQMSFIELRAYVVENREDIEALRFLISKRDPNSPKYPMPVTEADMQTQMEIIKRKINRELCFCFWIKALIPFGSQNKRTHSNYSR